MTAGDVTALSAFSPPGHFVTFSGFGGGTPSINYIQVTQQQLEKEKGISTGEDSPKIQRRETMSRNCSFPSLLTSPGRVPW